jgi:acyl-CoA thioesterase-1
VGVRARRTSRLWYERLMVGSIMRRWPWLRPLLPVAAIAAGWGGCTHGEGPLVAFLGDSLTAGYRLREDEAYPALVGATLRARGRPIRVVNAGKSGDTVRQGLARLPAVLRLRPDVVVVALGTNDALRGLPLDQAEADLDRIVRDSRASGARVLLVGVRFPGSLEVSDGRGLDALFARLAGAHHIPLVPDLLRGVTGHPELLMADELHPNAAGQQQLARNVTRDVELLLAELPR